MFMNTFLGSSPVPTNLKQAVPQNDLHKYPPNGTCSIEFLSNSFFFLASVVTSKSYSKTVCSDEIFIEKNLFNITEEELERDSRIRSPSAHSKLNLRVNATSCDLLHTDFQFSPPHLQRI